MKCKFCGAELERGISLCPACGRDNLWEEPEQEAPAKPKKNGLKIGIAIALVVVLAAGMVFAVLFGMQGGWAPRENDVQYKDNYTVSDSEAAAKAATVVATMKDRTLTNGELQIYYWVQVYDFLSEYGNYYFDYTKPLNEQKMSDDGMTWQQYFLEMALQTWQRYEMLNLMADEEDYILDASIQADLDGLRESMEAMAEKNKFETVDAMIQADMGPGCNFDHYQAYMNREHRGYQYFDVLYDKLEVTNDEINAYYTKNEATLKKEGYGKDISLVDVRHILIQVKGDTNKATTYTEQNWADCKAKAEQILNEWLSGAKTEESFADLANKYSEDPGSNTNGGLYKYVYEGQMVETFEDWCFDATREYGHYGLVKTSYGYHIMYFVEKKPDYFYDFRNIYIPVEGGKKNEDGQIVYSDAEWETCRAAAQAILDQWLAGNADAESFAALAQEKSKDNSSNANGGLYQNMDASQMSGAIMDWCAGDRKYGEYTLLKMGSGYHIVFFERHAEKWQVYVNAQLLSDKMGELIAEEVKNHPYEIDYKKIVLGNVELSK